MKGAHVDIDADMVSSLQMGYWEFPIYIGDLTPFGAQGLFDTKTGCICIHDGLATDHRFPVLAHEAIEAISHVWGNLGLTHDQVQIIGESLAAMMPSLFAAWFKLSSEERRTEILLSIYDELEQDGHTKAEDVLGILGVGETDTKSSPEGDQEGDVHTC